MAMYLDRPAGAAVTFDHKSGRTKSGLVLEHIKAGSNTGLLQYLGFYAARAKHGSLVSPSNGRLGLDEDFVAIFWAMFPCFMTPSAVTSGLHEIVRSCHNDRVDGDLDMAEEAGGVSDPRYALLQVMEALSIGIDPNNKYLLWLSPAQQAELLVGVDAILTTVRSYIFVDGSGVRTWGEDGRALAGAENDAFEQLESNLSLAHVAANVRSIMGSSSTVRPHIVLAAVAAALEMDTGRGEGDDMEDVRSVSDDMTSLLSSSAPLDLDSRLLQHFDDLWSMPCDVLAAQWTYIEHDLFRSIPMSEWLGCGWDKPRFEHASDAIRRYIDHFNAMALWVTAEILAQPTPRARAAMIVRFVKLAVLLLRFNNFSALVEVCIALRRDVVARLEQTWAFVPAAATKRLTEIMAITDDKKNYRAYKEALRKVDAEAPVVPHLGAHTAELTMQDQLLPTELAGADGKQLVHFRRYRELWKLTMPLVAMQEIAYDASMLPPQMPTAINLLNSTVRPFYFSFDEDRELAVERLQARSYDIEPEDAPGMGAAASAAGESGGEGGSEGDASGAGAAAAVASPSGGSRWLRRKKDVV